MALFYRNPLSLSVPDDAFESWLRDTGYLEILDERSVTSTESPIPPSSSSSRCSTDCRSNNSVAVGVVLGLVTGIIPSVRTVLSILTLNPFAKLTSDDFNKETPPWTIGFIGPSYSFPAGPSQARMRVHENVKRYARNYLFLSLLIFVCSLYQMPKSLLGLLGCLALWESMWFCFRRWNIEQTLPVLRIILLYVVQFLTASLLFYCNLQKVVMAALIISYAVMIAHASFRKLSPSIVGVSFQQNKYKT
ncbi:PRA1 family protein H [Zostera marina]|uniref:PRA1 family protein n=1 Tax=Zostera marina TaxID=29655 RepID=A0A0K9PLQ6_ZOSMR|nr:PRA1 family protein H [Zostera marina]